MPSDISTQRVAQILIKLRSQQMPLMSVRLSLNG
jgi:hypothetical protein